MASTINCIVCFEKATCFGGHVHRAYWRTSTHHVDEHIIAGFCKQHFKTPLKHTCPNVDGCKGCWGKWKEEMGHDKSFGQVMYIDRDGLHPIDDDELPSKETK